MVKLTVAIRNTCFVYFYFVFGRRKANEEMTSVRKHGTVMKQLWKAKGKPFNNERNIRTILGREPDKKSKLI